MARLDRAVTDIVFNRSVVGPTFRKQAQAFMDAVKALSPAELEKPPKTLKINGKDTEIPADAFAPKFGGAEDSHQAIGKGTVDFAAFFRLIRQHGARPVYTLEAHDAEDIEPSLERIRTLLQGHEG